MVEHLLWLEFEPLLNLSSDQLIQPLTVLITDQSVLEHSTRLMVPEDKEQTIFQFQAYMGSNMSLAFYKGICFYSSFNLGKRNTANKTTVSCATQYFSARYKTFNCFWDFDKCL